MRCAFFEKFATQLQKIHSFLFQYPPVHKNFITRSISDRKMTTPIFCYGSNGIDQIRERCQNPYLIARPALLQNYIRIFGGESKRWDHGAVASILNLPTAENTLDGKKSNKVYGSVVDLTPTEVDLLDVFEGVRFGIYRRVKVMGKVKPHVENVTIKQKGKNIHDCVNTQEDELKDEECEVYILNQKYSGWVREPSRRYLLAIQKNLEPFWIEKNNNKFSIEICNENGEHISTWVNDYLY